MKRRRVRAATKATSKTGCVMKTIHKLAGLWLVGLQGMPEITESACDRIKLTTNLSGN